MIQKHVSLVCDSVIDSQNTSPSVVIYNKVGVMELEANGRLLLAKIKTFTLPNNAQIHRDIC